jgi:hypothetical protein
MRRFNDTMKKSADRMGKLTKMVKAYWAEALVAYAAIKKLARIVKSLTDAYIADEKAEALLNSTLKATGIWTESLSKQLVTYADEMQKVTTFSNDQIMAAQGIMATFTQIGTEIYPEVTEAAMNMSTVFGGDLSQAMVRLGKVINDPRMAAGLREIGITMSEQQMEMIKYFMEIGDLASAQRVILDELQVEMGETARAVGETFGGQVEIATNLVDKWKASIGELLAEQAQPMIEWLIAFLKNSENLQKVTDILKKLGASFQIVFGLVAKFIQTNLKLIESYNYAWALTGKIIADSLNPKKWGTGAVKEALADLKKIVIETGKDIAEDYSEYMETVREAWNRGFGTDTSEVVETFAWIHQNAMQRVTAATNNATQAIKGYDASMVISGEALENYIEKHSVWEERLDAETELALERIRREQEYAEWMKNEMIPLMIEYSDRMYDMGVAVDNFTKTEKETLAAQQEVMNVLEPAYSEFFMGLGDQTIKFKEQLKDVFSSLLRMLGEEMLARAVAALVPLPGVFNPMGAAPAFAAAAAAFVASGLIKSLATGGQFTTAGPELIMVGDNPSGRERVTVEPLGGTTNNNLTMPLTIQFGNQTIRRQLQWQFDTGGVAIPQRIVV